MHACKPKLRILHYKTQCIIVWKASFWLAFCSYWSKMENKEKSDSTMVDSNNKNAQALVDKHKAYE